MFFKPAPDALPEQKGIDRYFSVPLFSFASIGMDPTSMQRTYVNYFMAWIPMMLLLILCFPIVIYASQYKDDLTLVTDALSPIWQAIMAILKIMYFMWNKKKIVKLVRKLWLWNLKSKGEELKILVDENHKCSKFSEIFYACVLATGVMALISPYSWDLSTHSGYAMAYIWELIGIYFILNGNLAIDSLFSWFMHNVTAHFRILQLLTKLDANMERYKDDEEKFCFSIKQRIRHHLRVIELAETFNGVYQKILFMKFTISCIQIAILTYQLAKGHELSAKLFHLLFIISVSLQLILYCYGGQRIQDESTRVADTIYLNFKWHDLSVKSQKLLLLPILRAQKPCTVTGVFFVADLRLYLWIFKTAGSFITLLLSMGEKMEN
ncbi:hypothetical protein DOY81_008478 [Sarcophaga bullata]|nr:hypothetical protein DOY81_008478 [Sarcophaga bullata]